MKIYLNIINKYLRIEKQIIDYFDLIKQLIGVKQRIRSVNKITKSNFDFFNKSNQNRNNVQTFQKSTFNSVNFNAFFVAITQQFNMNTLSTKFKNVCDYCKKKNTLKLNALNSQRKKRQKMKKQ